MVSSQERKRGRADQQRSGGGAGEEAGSDVSAGQLRRLGQVVDVRVVRQEEEAAEPFHPVRGALAAGKAVQLRLPKAAELERIQAGAGTRPELLDGAELDRVGRAGLRAGGLHPALEAV